MSDAARMVARLRTEKPTGPLMVAAAALIERDAARLARYEAALNKIASWNEGAEVGGNFDEPGSAKLARDALGATDSAPAGAAWVDANVSGNPTLMQAMRNFAGEQSDSADEVQK